MAVARAANAISAGSAGVAQPREQRACVAQIEARSARAQVLADAGGQSIEIGNADARIRLARRDRARRFEPDARRVQHVRKPARALDPALHSVCERRHEERQAVARKNEQRLRPVGHEAGKPRHGGGPRVVGVQQKYIEPRRIHCDTHARDARIEHRIGQLCPRLRDQPPPHGAQTEGA